jgi:antitoxin component YwqK of YwqJK toxin-antitoxin module
MTLEKIASYQVDDYEYTLSLISEDDRTVKTLFHNGEEEQRWETRYQAGRKEWIKYYENGEPEKTTYYRNGLITEEHYFTDEELDTVWKYTYREGKVWKIGVYDSTETLLYELFYYRSSSGHLRRVEKVYPSGESIVSAYTFGSSGLLEEWHGQQDEGEFFRFSGKGNLLSHETWKGDELTAVEQFDDAEQEGRVSKQENLETGVTTFTYYNEDERVIRKRRERDGQLIRTIRYEYEDGEIVYERHHTPGVIEEWYYERDAGGDLEKERYVKNSVLMKVTVHTGEKSYYEEIYRNGEVFLRVFFEDGVKVKETFVRGQDTS